MMPTAQLQVSEISSRGEDTKNLLKRWSTAGNGSFFYIEGHMNVIPNEPYCKLLKD